LDPNLLLQSNLGIDGGGGRGERHGPITPPNPMMAKKLKLFV